MSQQLWILVGGNGSGKSTFYNTFLRKYGLSFINADLIAKDLGEDPNPELSKRAQEIARQSCLQKLQDRETFCFETVFSHQSKVDLILKAKNLGYEINLVYFHLSSTNLNIARVVQRVSGGGHNVPHDKVESRVPRTIQNVKKVIGIVDQAKLVDNSSAQDPFKTVATVQNRKVIQNINPLPDWAAEILANL